MLGFKLANKRPLSLLCLGAHCDDIEIGAGGTILKLANHYEISSAHWVVFASDKTRKKEAEQSAAQFLSKVQSKKVIINSWRDGFLPFSAVQIKDYFESLKHEILPDLILTHFRDDRHQDHRIISDLTWNTWRNHLILEYEIPKYDGDLGNPNFYVPLDAQLLKMKNDIIIDSYASQCEKHWFDDKTFSALPRLRGMEAATLFAEAFYSRKICL
jgi:LmbE family N-acetylglucosaminyl deacetylase